MSRTENEIYLATKKGIKHLSLDITDFHAHLGPTADFYCPDSSAKAMLCAMDKVGISRMCVSSMPSLSSDYHLGNIEVLEAMRKFPDRIFGFAVINPRYPKNMCDELDFCCKQNRMKGIKIHPAYHNCKVTDPSYSPVFEFASCNNLPVLIHTWDDFRCHPNLFDSLSKAYSNVCFVLGHSGMPDFISAAEVAKKHENIFLELTAAAYNNGVIEYFVKEIGDDRVLYGSDMGGWFCPAYGIGSVLYAKISDDSKEKILSKNAKGILGLH